MAQRKNIPAPIASAVSEFRRLSGEPFHWLHEDPADSMTAPTDLSPMKMKAREAVDALNDAMKAADAGRSDDAKQALQRAKASIDAALGGQLGPGGMPMAGVVPRY